MNKILLVTISCILVLPVPGKSQWILQDNLPVSNQLKSVYVFDNNKLIAAGENGTVIRSTNAGVNWTVQTGIGGPYNRINSVCFVNESTGWIVGTGAFPNYGSILKTTNAGDNWFMQSSDLNGNSHILNSVRFINSNTGWAAGAYGALTKTTNGGTNWIRQYSTGNTFYSVFFTDIFNGWIAGAPPGFFNEGDIYKSENGGENWTVQNYGTGFQDSVIYSIYFTDNNTGWMSGFGGHIFKTTNSGNNWIRQANTYIFALHSLYFINNFTGWAVGTFGDILKTTNGGNSWVTQSLNMSTNLNSVCFSDSSNGWIVGDKGVILRTTNGGTVDLELNSNEIPGYFKLGQNYPNPFNPETKINFELPKTSVILLKVYDIMGRLIEVIVNKKLEAGIYVVNWNGSKYNNGVYFYKFESEQYSETRKMLLIK